MGNSVGAAAVVVASFVLPGNSEVLFSDGGGGSRGMPGQLHLLSTEKHQLGVGLHLC